jgi:hypothetical protein
MEKVVGGNDRYLHIGNLCEGMRATKLAYLINAQRKVDRYGDPYLRFRFRTADKAVVWGRKFKVSREWLSGTDLLRLNRTLVLVEFTVSLFNGSFSLLVDSITTAVSEDVTPFLGAYEGAANAFLALNSRAAEIDGKPLNPSLRTLSLGSLMGGQAGGYLRLLSMVSGFLHAAGSSQEISALRTLFSLALPYSNYLQIIETLEFVPKSDMMRIVWSAAASDDLGTSVVQDALSALMGMCAPDHVIAHRLVRAFELARFYLKLEEVELSSPKNLLITLDGGERLINY